MSRRRILDMTSVKKRDTMLATTYSTDTGTTVNTRRVAGTTVNGQDGGFYVFCPTARDLLTSSNLPGYPAQQAARTSQFTYMKGYSERLRIQTNTGAAWFHRRICFTTRSSVFATSTGTPTVTILPYADDTTRGMSRLWLNQANNNAATYLGLVQGILFKGRRDSDWNDLITAPVDTARVDLKYDRTFTHRSGNANGMVKELKLWHPMNKGLVYDDDENGDAEDVSYFSVNDKRGMGDFYVIDIFQSTLPNSASDLININNTSTLYWHEK